MVRIHRVGIVVVDGDSIVMVYLGSSCLSLGLRVMVSGLIGVLLRVVTGLLVQP